MRFKCNFCDQWHEGIPALSAEAPLYYYSVPENERERRCRLTADTCVVDEKYFFVKGCLEIPIQGSDDRFEWGAWVSLSTENFAVFTGLLRTESRSRFGPYFGWLSAAIAGYPDTENLKTKVHLRDNGIRPFIELEPTDHPLAIEQRSGISIGRLAEICSPYLH
jgi:hypothetical protein